MSLFMIPQVVYTQFGLASVSSCEVLSQGLINNSYKVIANNETAYFLQQVNTSIFTNPLALQENYMLIEQHLSSQGSMQLPGLIRTTSGDLLYDDNNHCWRCFEFLNNTYSPKTLDTPELAYETAHCFGRFTAALHKLDSRQIKTVLPHFHDLSFRFEQFRQALQNTSPQLAANAKDLIRQVEKQQPLVHWFLKINGDKTAFPLHIMHHDCKISNILFDGDTHTLRCPVDLDTTQPGLFFSDIGDMIRTMTPDQDENAPDSKSLQFRPAFYHAIINGYLDAMANYMTEDEKVNLPKAGMVMIYMQAMRFLADYLNGNVYYKTEYTEQNKDRAANQLQLLQLLQDYVQYT